jgi:phosphatidyl-myo-inositol alpha-mannosyltransferase
VKHGVKHVVLSIFDDVGNPHYGGGGPVVVHQIATRLAKDYRVTVYSGSYRGSRREVRDGVEYVFLPVGWAGPRLGQLLFQLLLPVVALVRPPDVWIESLTPPFSASLLPLLSPSPVIGLVQMLSAADMARKYRLPFPLVERRGLALYRHFVVLNETDRVVLRACNKRARPVLIPNGVTRRPVADAEFGRGGYILFLGRVDVQQKGLDLLLAAVREAPPGLPLVIAGSGTRAEERKLRDLVGRTGHPVRLVGRVSGAAKEDLLRGCAFVVLPSRFETFSLAALEAMAHGKPVVCFDLPRLAWIRADCAVRVPPFDVPRLAAAMGELAAGRAYRARLGRQAYALAGEYDWDVIGERYRSLVAAMLDADGTTVGRPGRGDRPGPGSAGQTAR